VPLLDKFSSADLRLALQLPGTLLPVPPAAPELAFVAASGSGRSRKPARKQNRPLAAACFAIVMLF